MPELVVLGPAGAAVTELVRELERGRLDMFCKEGGKRGQGIGSKAVGNAYPECFFARSNGGGPDHRQKVIRRLLVSFASS